MSEKTPKQQEGLENLHGRLRSLIRNISGKYDLEVTSTLPPSMLRSLLAKGQDPNKHWMRVVELDRRAGRPSREYVYVPPTIMESNEVVALGKAAHEASHAAISRTELLQEDIPKNLVGFNALEAALEERPTDQYVRVNYPGAGRWLDEARRDSSLEPIRDGVDLAQIKERAPLFSQLSALIVYEPTLSQEEISERYADRVIEVYNRVKAKVEAVESTLPNESDSEDTRRLIALERLRIVHEEIYPEVLELLEIDKQNAEEQELLNEISQNPEFSLPPELAELLKQIMESIEELREEQAADDKAATLSSPGADASGGEKEDGEKTESIASSAADSDEEMDDSETGAPGGPSAEGGPTEDESTAEASSPSLHDLTPEIRSALTKLLEQLSEEIKDELEKRAREKLEQVEKEIVEEAKSELSEEHEAAEETTTSDREKEEKPESSKSKSKPDLEDIRERIEAADAAMEARLATTRAESTRFDEVYEDMREQEQLLYRRLEGIFYPNVKSKIKLTASGSTINIPALFRYESTKEANPSAVDMRIFERHTIPETKDYAFTLLVDLSGSMRGENIEEAFKATVMLAETLNRIGIKNEVLGFQDRLIVFKEADQTLDNKIRKRIAGMEDEVRGSNPGGHNEPHYNDDGPCVAEASERLEALPAREKFLVVISDGMPCGMRSSSRDLHDAISHITTRTGQHLVGLGLGSDTDHVESFYPQAIANIEASNLADTLSGLMISLMEKRGG